jgi:uncharacterized protein (DUF2141 family)
MKRILTALAGLATMGAAPAPGSDLKVELDGLRSGRGVVHLCLTSSQRRFLGCKEDRSAVARTVPAGEAQRLDLGRVRPGTYALLIVHDENGNGKLDMMMGIPREGFGFSNNPAMRPRAPRWEEIRFTMPATALKQQVRVRYVL